MKRNILSMCLFAFLLVVIGFAACSKSQPAPAPEATAPVEAPQTAPEQSAPQPEQPAAQAAPEVPAAPADPNYLTDVVYGNADGVELKMDIAKPTGEGPFPAVLCIHGGGWQLGKKADFAPTAVLLAANGYVAATVDYRMIPDYPWPAQIEDVKCAVRYLRANAQELNINPDKIGAIGHSAGGHLALMLGLTNSDNGFDGTGGYQDQPSNVQAVVGLSGLTNFATWKPWPEVDEPFQKEYGKTYDGLLTDLLGTADRSAKAMAEASPVSYVDAGDPPVLIVHGDADPLVPYDQATELAEVLKKEGAPHKLAVIEGANHGYNDEQLPLIIMETTAFFNEHLNDIAPEPAPEATQVPSQEEPAEAK